MKSKTVVLVTVVSIVALGLVVVHQVLAGGSFAPVPQSGPPARLDGAGASFSGVDGATATGGSFTLAPAGFPPNRLSGADVSDMPGWDTDAGHIGDDGIDNGTVYALAVDQAGNVYVGGDFTDAGGVAAADYLARWSSVDGWSPVGSVITGPVHAIAIDGGDVYVGGDFSDPDFGTYPINNVARWDGSNWWPLRGGVKGPINALAIAGDGDVYVGGAFTETVNSGTTVNGIARWSPSPKGWHELSAGVTRLDSSPGQVNALVIDGKDVYVGGDFYYAGDSGDSMSYVARWDSAASQWESVDSELAYQVDGLATNGSELYVAARTSTNGGFRVEQVDLADNSWTQLASSDVCGATTCDRVYALAASQSNLFVGGRFSAIDGVSARWIARWNSRNETWFALGSGISDSGHQQQDDGVWAFALDGGDLYAGGDFQHANGQDAHRLAHWVPYVADLGVFQETTPSGTIHAGERITYEVTVLHHGYQKAKDVVLEDVLPAEVTLEQADCGSGTFVPPATCELGNLKAGARETVRFVASLPPTLTTGMTLTNVANVAANQYDPALAAVFPANNTYTVTTPVARRVVLRLDKEAPAAADVGDAVPYTLTVTNDGPSVATAVVLTDTLPDGVLLKSYPGGGACSGTNARVVCQLGEMQPHDSETIVIEVTPYVVGILTNEARASAPEVDAPATATADTDVSGTIGMHILKTDGVGEVGLNEPLTYTLTVWATGTPLVEDVRITDTLPSAVMLRSVDVSTGTCSGTATVLCEVGDLTGGAFVSVTIGVTPTVEGTLVNTAQVGGSDVDTASDTDDDTHVRDVADLQVTKSGPGAATAGQAFDYTITVVNDGPASTTDVTLTDDLPDGLYLNGWTASQGTCSWLGGRASAAVTCDLGAMANGAGAEVTLNVTPLVTGTMANTASASSAKADDVSANDADTLQTPVGPGTTDVRTMDGLTIEAYVFVDLTGGDTTAYGVVSLGDHFTLSGPNDAVTFGSGALTGHGTLTFKQGHLPVWKGDFSSSAAAGWELTLGTGASALPHLAGFALDGSGLSSVNLLTGQVTGDTTQLRLEPPGCSAVVSADFTITPGPVFSGTLPDAFTLAAGAFDLDAPAGATLSNDGVSASPVDLVLPAYFGAGRVEGATLTIRPNNLLLGGSAGVAFDVPDLRFDDQDALVIKDAQGMLARLGGEYVIVMWEGDLHVTLPGNTPVIPLGEARLTASGEIDVERLDAFPLEVAGGTLTVEYAFLTNPELAVTEAVFQWPTNLGGNYKNVPDVHVTASGTLSVSGNTDIALPDILILGGETLRVNHPIANLIEGANGYTFDLTDGDVLVMLLQQNDHILDLAAGEVDLDGHFRGRMVQDTLTLDVAGAELTISGLSSGWPLNDTTGLAIGPAVSSQYSGATLILTGF